MLAVACKLISSAGCAVWCLFLDATVENREQSVWIDVCVHSMIVRQDQVEVWCGCSLDAERLFWACLRWHGPSVLDMQDDPFRLVANINYAICFSLGWELRMV